MYLNFKSYLTSAIVLTIFLCALAHVEMRAQNAATVKIDTAQNALPDVDEEDSYIDQLKTPADVDYLKRPLPSREFDPADWKKATQGLHYPIQLEPELKLPPVGKNKAANPFFKALLGALFLLLKWVVYIGFGGGIVYLLARFLTGGNIFAIRSRKIKHSDAPIELNQIEEYLPGANLDEYIRQALAQKNYILAIRLYHLSIVRELSASGAVEWKKGKTNRAYLQEMRNNGLYEPFRRATRIFEKVWYGDAAFGETDFDVVQPDFQSLLNRARQKT